MSKSREELKKIAKQILDYRRNDHTELLLSLTTEEQIEITPLLKEVTEEKIAKEREEHETFMKQLEDENKEHLRFIAERKAYKPFFFPFPLGEA